jgi:hypothetical protein
MSFHSKKMNMALRRMQVKEMVAAAFAGQENDRLTKEEFKRWVIRTIGVSA